MAVPPRSPDPNDGIDVGTDRGSPPRAPRWVKVSAIIVGVLILLVVIVKLTGLGGEHGPGRHMGAGGSSPTAVIEIQALLDGDPGHAAPAGSH